MRDLLTTDGIFWFVEQDDGNVVVYLKNPRTGQVIKDIWDKWSWEAANPPIDNGSSPIPIPPDIEDHITPVYVDSNPVLIRRNVNPIGMSYWRNINQHRNQDVLDVALTDPDDYVVILSIDKRNLRVLSERRIGVYHTGEGIHYSAHNPYHLYVPYGEQLVRFNTVTLTGDIVWRPEPGQHLWQCHISYDESVFSASIQNSNYEIIKWGVNYRGQIKYFPLRAEPDECQVDKSGEHLLIKEKDGNDEYNRIVHIASGREQIVRNREGAIAHGDCGFECGLGENDYSNFGGALDFINFKDVNDKRNIYHSDVWNMGYFSFSNAVPGNRESQFGILSSSDNRLIQVKLDGNSRMLCDLKTQSQDYKYRSKANICPNGEYAIWTALVDGQLNAYMIRVPAF